MAEFHRLLARLKGALEPPSTGERGVTDAAVPVSPIVHRAELASRFGRELETAGGRFLGILEPAEAARRLLAIARERSARTAAVGEGVACDTAALASALAQAGCAILWPREAKDGGRGSAAAELARCDLSVAEAHCAIASSGTFAVLGAPASPDSLTLLASASVLIAHVERLVPDLAAALGALGAGALRAHRLTLITGPSRTDGIASRTVLGVHGPGALYGAIIWPRDE